MNLTIVALRDILKADDDLDYASDSGYASTDIGELIQGDRYPFFNIIPGQTTESFTTTDGFSIEEFQRHIIPITIQFAVRFLEPTFAVLGDGIDVGIAEFTKTIWAVIQKDKTLVGVVSGIVKGSDIDVTPVEVVTNESSVFIQGREMTIEFYRDEEV